MTALLLAALGVHVAACVLVTGAFFVLLLAGPPPICTMRRWERRVLSAARWLVLVALGLAMVLGEMPRRLNKGLALYSRIVIVTIS